jgi:hypothetical protein
VSALLRQPCGFESVALVEIDLASCGLAVSECPNHCDLLSNPDAAPPAGADDAIEMDDIVSGRYEPIVLGMPVRPDGVEVLAVLRHALQASIGLAFDKRRMEFDLRMEDRERRLGVATVEGVDEAAKLAHVLLRHRPLSIPQVQESA